MEQLEKLKQLITDALKGEFHDVNLYKGYITGKGNPLDSSAWVIERYIDENLDDIEKISPDTVDVLIELQDESAYYTSNMLNQAEYMRVLKQIKVHLTF